MGIAEQLMGKGKVLPVQNAQMAMRFPSLADDDVARLRGHLDGMGNGKNGMAKGVYRRGFTAFAVVYLSDVPDVYHGNFTVWPKSHRFFEDYFKSNGHEVLANGMPRMELPEPPVQIVGNAGDAVIAHHQMVHTGGPNASPDVRYAAITRLRHVDCEEIGFDAYTDIWEEWEGVRSVMEELQPEVV
jgi:ectoine hydroxylase-related dioxygenase (phytanoyl-CoA dioxygenase family)